MIRPFAALVALCIFAGPGQAHEFWISPEDYTVPSGTLLTASFRNGETFSGSTLSYVPNRAVRTDIAAGGRTVAYPGRVGDNPAIGVNGLPDGLVVLVHETAPATLTYRPKDDRTGWERFVQFADHKDFAGAIEAHRARGLPEEGVTERYRRFAKALVAVGGGVGSDAPTGLQTEIVALANPYTDDLSAGLPVRVLLDGQPRADAQVELFAKDSEGEVAVTLHRTDADGVATLPVEAGHEYLADAVVLLPAEDGVMWETLWAALTFAVPEG